MSKSPRDTFDSLFSAFEWLFEQKCPNCHQKPFVDTDKEQTVKDDGFWSMRATKTQVLWQCPNCAYNEWRDKSE